MTEVAKHNKREDCWCIIHDMVYDLTSFLDEHPGGSQIILKYAGKDATKAFDPIHPSDIIEKLLSPALTMGSVRDAPSSSQVTKSAKFVKSDKLPPLDQMLNLNDYEAQAQKVMTPQAWAYYSSAADDSVTEQENRNVFSRIWMVPRVLRDVSKISLATEILGHKSRMPVYVTATALGKLGHPEGEVVLTRAAGARGVIQMIPTLASCSLDEIVAAADGNQVQFMQLYANANKDITKALVQKAERLGCKSLFLTVDAPVLAKREADMRQKFTETAPKVQDESTVSRSQGAARAISSFIDSGLQWSDVPWFQSITTMPLVLKGVQCAEDAVMAYDAGCAGVVLSNHGGRQLDYARSGIEVLVEVVEALKRHGATRPFELYIDGGIRRGTDVFKALALGATAVGIGRPLLYAMSTYGDEGVKYALDILYDELEMVCRLMGVTDIRKVNSKMLRYPNLFAHLGKSML